MILFVCAWSLVCMGCVDSNGGGAWFVTSTEVLLLLAWASIVGWGGGIFKAGCCCTSFEQPTPLVLLAALPELRGSWEAGNFIGLKGLALCMLEAVACNPVCDRRIVVGSGRLGGGGRLRNVMFF